MVEKEKIQEAPEGWVEIILSNVFESYNQKEKQIKSSDYSLNGLYPIVDQSVKKICGYSDNMGKLIDNNLPFIVFGDHTRHVKYIDFPFIAGADGTQILKAKENIVDDKLFYYIISVSAERIGNYGYDRHFKHLKEYKFFIPRSITEQRTIASVLSTCDEAIEKTDAKIEKLKRIKQGLMQDLFRYGIDENGKMRSEATHRFKDSPLGRIPEEWEVVPLEDFANKDKFAIVDGPFGSNLKIVHYRESGIPVIQSGFVTTGKFIADSYLYVDESKFKAEIRSKVIPGDIVMAKIGAQCGKCAILPPDHYVGILAGNCLKITVSKKYLNTYLWTLLSYYYELGILSLVISTTAQPAVNMKALKSLTMPRPDLNEQNNIIVVLSSADEAIEKEEAYKNKLLALKRGLMDDLLSGKVRVNKLIKEAA